LRRETWAHTSKRACTTRRKESGDEPGMLWEMKLGLIRPRGHAWVGDEQGWGGREWLGIWNDLGNETWAYTGKGAHMDMGERTGRRGRTCRHTQVEKGRIPARMCAHVGGGVW
jgi:hypothetical protein